MAREPGGEHCDVEVVGSRAAARAALPASLQRVAYFGQPFPELLGWGVGALNPEHLRPRLDYERARKTGWELACLREASLLGARGHLAAARTFRAGAPSSTSTWRSSQPAASASRNCPTTPSSR